MASPKLKDFDLLAFLNDYEIDYRQSAKNVGTGWIGLSECPFCGAPGYHFGINLRSKGYSCWVCHTETKGGVPTLISALLDIPRKSTIEIIQKYSTKFLDFKTRETGQKVILPSKLKPISEMGLQYLKKRNFNENIIEKYHLQDTGIFSKMKVQDFEQDFKFRIFIPIIMNHEIVSYTARDYTEEQEPKYQHPVLEAVKIAPSSCIYNIDTVKDRMLILEGPTDVWRMQEEAVSMQGIKITKEQIRCIAERNLKKVVILFDEHAEEAAKTLSRQLSGLVDNISVAFLSEGDPAELSEIDAIKIKRNLLYG